LALSSCTLQQTYTRGYLRCVAVQETPIASAGVYVSGCGRDAWCENDRKRGWRCRDISDSKERLERQIAIETKCPPSQLIIDEHDLPADSFRVVGCGHTFDCEPGPRETFDCRLTAPAFPPALGARESTL
jgi:hypothetical protein